MISIDLSPLRDEVAANAGGNSVSHIRLTGFRNYSSLDMQISPLPVVLTGFNGAGKTNLLEAVSFLSPGRGLRGVSLAEVDQHGSDGGWSVSAMVVSDAGNVRLGTGRDINSPERRRVSIDGESSLSQQVLAEYVSVIWLTPAMDGIFTGAAQSRRKFFDRIVYSFFPDHAALLNKYERALRERNRLLAMPRPDGRWLDAAEQQIVQYGLAVAACRNDALRLILPHIGKACSFPVPELSIDGEVEAKTQQIPAVEAEEWWRGELRASRHKDMLSGRTAIGVHRSDFIVRFALKNQPAHLCSTGEQKALMLSLIMAVARARREWTGRSPILLLDEVVAHLDAARREDFFGQLVELGVQAWMTGTDISTFSPLGEQAQFLTVNCGKVME